MSYLCNKKVTYITLLFIDGLDVEVEIYSILSIQIHKCIERPTTDFQL